MTNEQAEKCAKAAFDCLDSQSPAYHSDIFAMAQAIKDAADEPSGFKIKPDVFISRKEDMSPKGYLQLYMENDSDIIVLVHSGDSDESDPATYAHVQFCTYAGGGKSQRTLAALRLLAEAMALDSKEDKFRKGDNDQSEECFE